MNEAIESGPGKDPHLPPMGRLEDLLCPRAPQTIAEVRLEDGALMDLAVKFAYNTNRFTAEFLMDRLHISPAVTNELVTELVSEGMIEETMMTSQERPVFRVNDRGRRHAER